MPRRAARWRALVIAATVALAAGRPGRAETAGDTWTWTPFRPCPHCNLYVGVGATFNYFQWTDGLVVPITLELDDSRWELGAFRFTTSQYLKEPTLYPPSTVSAGPYWGFSGMRRWQVLHRNWWRIYLGAGVNYRDTSDLLETTTWNFSYLVGVRLDLGGHGAELEIAARHWSNAWFRTENRGQNLVTITFSY